MKKIPHAIRQKTANRFPSAALRAGGMTARKGMVRSAMFRGTQEWAWGAAFFTGDD
jgi:hypothetical protein